MSENAYKSAKSRRIVMYGSSGKCVVVVIAMAFCRENCFKIFKIDIQSLQSALECSKDGSRTFADLK